ncbi:hypothetical protein, partial [Enterococcus faecalis]|uniref:hypothetical protein n=1 Tax=Enterococcus faecalis TaxID=1351 RepID=UPI003D1430DE
YQTAVRQFQTVSIKKYELFRTVYFLIKRYQHGTQKQTLKMIKNQLKNWNAGQLSCSAAIRKGD